MASLSSLSERTIRYYEEQGLIKAGRSEGGQRWYTDEDLVYLRRIIELKGLGFSLVEIRRIFELKDSDRSGNLRRKALLSEYRKKLDEDLGKLEALQKEIQQAAEQQLQGMEHIFDFCCLYLPFPYFLRLWTYISTIPFFCALPTMEQFSGLSSNSGTTLNMSILMLFISKPWQSYEN